MGASKGSDLFPAEVAASNRPGICFFRCHNRHALPPCPARPFASLPARGALGLHNAVYCRADAKLSNWPRGPMDKASAYGAGDCRFESCRGHYILPHRHNCRNG